MPKLPTERSSASSRPNGKRRRLASDANVFQEPDEDIAANDGEAPDDLDTKRPRTYMATLACDNCRARKTRCDEDRPRCGFCKVIDAQCNYPEPRSTKKDQSMAVAINAIRRLEAKVEGLTTVIHTQRNHLPQGLENSPASPASFRRQSTSGDHDVRSSPRIQEAVSDTAYPSQPITLYDIRSPLTTGPSGQTALSFSQHRVVRWPAVKRILPDDFVTACQSLHKGYVVELEMQRSTLPMSISPIIQGYGEHWLNGLPLSVIKGLADAYFTVFNRINPVLDKVYFYSTTLGAAMENDFGYDIETCLVLNVLALGCLAVKAYEEGNFFLPLKVSGQDVSAIRLHQPFRRPDWYEVITDEPCGLRFFNEARKRIGFLICQNDLQNSQFYMLSAVYHAQILRPIDSWTMINRAALCCLTLIKRNDTIDYDVWEGDMQSRVFWNILMHETILIQELHLPLSGLGLYEAEVPLPKFTPCSRPYPSRHITFDEDDAFFNFHFLAQVAHRIILTRIRHSLYFFSEKESVPSPAIYSELCHQLEQWRSNLPSSLQFSDTAGIEDGSPSPAYVVARAMLKSRYLVAKFHIGRPFIYKVIHAPSLATEDDFRAIHDGLSSGMDWPATIGLCSQMKASLPIKFGWCCQFFGQVVLFHAVARSRDPKLQETLPNGWREWTDHMMEFIGDCANYSPSIAKDAELLSLL